MSREVCMHGVELYGASMCANCIDDGRSQALQMRRAEWIRTNAARFFDGNDMDASVDLAEYMADILIARGYL